MQVESRLKSTPPGRYGPIIERHPDLLSVGSTAAFVVDVQENFRAHIHEFEAMVAATCLLLRGLDRLGVPVVISEQYPQGLGRTIEEIAELTPGAARFEKLEISSVAAPGWAQLPAEVREAPSVLVVGIEAHVCVNQTVHDLLHIGRRVHVVSDAIGARDPLQKQAALQQLARAGAKVTTVEMALFELLGCAGTPEFKDIQRLIKVYDAERQALSERGGMHTLEVGR